MIPHIIDQADEPAALRGEVRHYQRIARQAVRQSTRDRIVSCRVKLSTIFCLSVAAWAAVYFAGQFVRVAL